MTKKLLSLLLIIVLSFSTVIPVFSASSGEPIMLEDRSQSESLYSAYGGIYDYDTEKKVQFDYTVPSNGATVVLFYSVGDSTSPKLFDALAGTAWASSSAVNFIAVEISGATKAQVAQFMKTNGGSLFVDKNFYNTDTTYLVTWYMNYVKNNGSTSNMTGVSFTYCYALFATSNGSKKYIRFSDDSIKNASDISSRLEKIMDTSALADGYGGYLDSGFLDNGKLPKAEISRILTVNPRSVPSNDSDYFVTAPSVKKPYSTGEVNDEYLQAATNRLSALRRIAGLDAVVMDDELNKNAQYGAVLLAASNFSHYPTQPSDMDTDFFNTGTEATSSSNIFAGRALTFTPDGFMDDSDAENVDRLGHRRWQLSPVLGKVGFGFAINKSNSNGYGRYTVEKVFDYSAKAKNFMYISWPASGNFPNQLFAGDVAWSVSLSPNRYNQPSKDKVSVTLTRTSDGKKWTFSNSETYTASSSGKYFNVETSGYGYIENCIIFRPNGISKYEGEYTVVIKGLEDSFNNAVTLTYKVDFFDADSVSDITAGWVKENGFWYYFKSDLTMATGWQKISGKWYYFNASGQMQTGWQKIGGKWYRFNSSGAMLTGWQKIGTKWYYFNSSGAMLTGWQKISKKWYYFNSSGAMLTGWQKISKKWYYFNSSGVMQTGWLKLSGKWYYLNSSGVMLANCSQKIGSKTYKFDKNGVCLNP